MSASDDSKPWYIRKRKNQLNLLHVNIHENSTFLIFLNFMSGVKRIFALFFHSMLAFLFAFGAGFCFAKLYLFSLPGKEFLLFLSFGIAFLFLSIWLFVAQIGAVCVFFMEKKFNYSNFILGAFYIQSKIEKSVPKKGLLAPEMILRQFLQQVRIYSAERSYYYQKLRDNHDNMQGIDDRILKRRWNDVQNTIDEFDIYLAQNPNDIIERLVSETIQQNLDVSHIFREIAETAESTWRAKGINIEHAIVVPLKADTNDKLLKRLLAGPWRSCAFFALKGSSIVFSAQSEYNKIIAHWECHSIAFPDKFFKLIQNQTLSVNERIEQSLELIANDPKNFNALFGVISLIIWHDLAKAAKVDFNISQSNDGMTITLKI